MKLFGWLRDRRLPREIDDPRRYGIICTHHAQEQAGERYRRGNQWAIIADIADALCAEPARIGQRSPSIPVRKARHGARLVWTEDFSRIYVIYQRKRSWFVLTALPTAEDEVAVGASVLRRFFRPDQGAPAVAVALEEARERLEAAR